MGYQHCRQHCTDCLHYLSLHRQRVHWIKRHETSFHSTDLTWRGVIQTPVLDVNLACRLGLSRLRYIPTSRHTTSLDHGFLNCGRLTTTGAPRIVLWNAAFSEKLKYNNTDNVSMIVTRRRVHIKSFVVEKQWVLRILCVCFFILYYTTCNAHAPYCIVICGLSGSTIFFPHYVIRQDFRETLVDIKSMFW